MRVIAGTAGGVRLAVPKRRVRPTTDRVKAAIFSSLGDMVIGARVLDLFAGSGALGIEALSRGAASAVFVEDDPGSAEIIEKNLAKTRLKGRVRQQDVFNFLRQASGVGAALSALGRSPRRAPREHEVKEKFDIIFADPPYEKTKRSETYTRKLLTTQVLPRLIGPRGVFVLEKRPGENLAETELWRVARQKTYGATEVLFLSAIRNPQSALE